MKGFSIREMTENEVTIAIEWARKEGWNPGLNDANCFYQADPQGFFVGLLDDQPIAVGSAVTYGESYAFCGLYIVKPEFRNQGYGLKLTEEQLKYVGKRITGIDGVLENVSKYERIGYIPSHKQIRYEWTGIPEFHHSPHVIDIKAFPFDQLDAFDRKYFPAPRSLFLKGWISQSNSYALGYVDALELKGYGVIRKCYHGYKVGPLFAETPLIAQALFEGLCLKIDEGPVYIDIPEPNSSAQMMVKYYKMTSKFEVIRMYRNGFPEINLHEGIFGVTTFELG